LRDGNNQIPGQDRPAGRIFGALTEVFARFARKATSFYGPMTSIWSFWPCNSVKLQISARYSKTVPFLLSQWDGSTKLFFPQWSIEVGQGGKVSCSVNINIGTKFAISIFFLV